MNPILNVIVNFTETEFPGSKVYIDFALANIDQAKVATIISRAMLDWQNGMSFVAILKDLIAANLPAGAQLP